MYWYNALLQRHILSFYYILLVLFLPIITFCNIFVNYFFKKFVNN